MLKLNKKIMVGGLTAALAITAFTGCSHFQRGDGDRTAGRVVDDKRISGQVESALNAEPIYKFDDVDVKTFNGVVQLSGFVSTDEQKTRAGEIAQRVPGVQQVVNSLAMKNTGNVSATGSQTGTTYGTNQPAAAPITTPDGQLRNNQNRQIDND